MKIACLCPTYGRPRLVSNALACFLSQDYPQSESKFLILDDAKQIADQDGDNWHVYSASKFPSLTSKYAFLVDRANEWGADAYCAWDDDDIYLQWHLSAHVEALKINGWSHPKNVFSLFTGRLHQESAAGRFHAAIAIRKDYAERIGYWGVSKRCDYDQEIIRKLTAISEPGRPDQTRLPSFVMRWGSTGANHCSVHSTDPNSTSWYIDTPITEPGYINKLEPKMDQETKEIFDIFNA
ncbi:MAG: glycosyltransferase family 2 protein [Candidatus Cloacimonetes bacterium]|jgi:hypothetical protein|nr:glycosyltransferase family 2 protein [Candidatus Cloacimonadota bacterium]